MKAILVLCALALVTGGWFVWHGLRQPNVFGTFTGAEHVDTSELAAKPESFLHKTVSIEGQIRQQCEAMGCFFYFFSGKSSLRVDLQDIAMTAPRRNGRQARVEGQIVPYGDGYQFVASGVEFR